MTKVIGIWNITETGNKIFFIYTCTDENWYSGNSMVHNATENV